MLAGTVRRTGRPLVLENIQHLSTSAALQQAVPATQEAVKKSSGFLSKLLGLTSDRIAIPLTDPLPNVPQPSPVAPPSSAPPTEGTTLPNGVKVVSEATYGPTATIGVFVNSGSVYETNETAGCSHLLEYLAFKATQNRTTFRLIREIEALGTNVVAHASREQMVYGIDVIRTNASEGVEILSDAILNPRLNPWEVDQAISKLRDDLKRQKANHESELTEACETQEARNALQAMHAVGFEGALSRPLICPEEALAGLNADKVAQFLSDNYTANRIVVGASGLSHQELVPLTEPLFSQVPQGQNTPEPKSSYVGGDYRRNSIGSLTHSLLAFQTPGGWRDLKTSVTVAVLQFLLGGGGSFTSGGPGKGMHSRLYRNVLANHAWVHNIAAFSSLYNDLGIFGITASAESSQAERSIDILVKELQAVTRDVSSEELQRAKNGAIGQVLINLESRAIVAEDIGRQVLTYGHRKPAKEIIDAMRAVQASDISTLVASALKTPLTHASIGEIQNIPRIDDLSARFK